MTLPRTLLAWAIHLLTWPLFVLKPKLRRDLWARYWLNPAIPPRDGPKILRIWAHGASAGDVLCLQPLLEELGRRRQTEVLVTAFTSTGVDMAREQLDALQVTVQPFDLPGPCARAVTRIDADLLLLERAELWPVLIDSAHRHGTGVVLVNGRLSPGALPYYRAGFALMGNPLGQMDRLLLRDDDEAQRARGLGATGDRIHVIGNTKLDRALRPSDPGKEAALREAFGSGGSLLVAGSTHEGEEGPLLDAFVQVRARHPAARLLIAPRYLERAAVVECLVKKRDLPFTRRSRKDDNPAKAAVILLDTLGELSSAYALADLAFVGGSLIPRGGQNMLEPAALGVPVLVGPHTFDASDQLALLKGQGLEVVKDSSALASRWIALLDDPELRARQSAAIAAAVRQGTGASRRAADVLLDFIDARF